MSATQKNLQYYLEHTDEMPTDPKELERLANEQHEAAMGSGQDQLTIDRFVTPDEKAASSPAVEEAAPAAEAKATPATEATPEVEAKPDGVLAKDGKHVIPYSQLESARARAVAAENLAKEQAARISALEAAATQPATAVESEMLTEDELQALEADSPTLAKVIRTQQEAISRLTEQVNTVANVQQNDAAVQQTAVKSEIQTAIDANPTLAEWQTAADQTAWERASAFDKTLRAMPEYANVSFADRFKVVEEMTRTALKMPAAEPEPQTQQELTPEQIKAVAAAKLAQVQKAKRPTSLSDIPGGAPPAVDERAKVEEASPVALGQQFLGMTREQLDAYLATL